MPSSVLLELAGLRGSSKVSGHENWIELESYNWSMRNSVNLHQGNSRGTGTVSIENLVCTKIVDATSPELQARCCTGEAFSHARIHVIEKYGDKKPVVAMIIKVSPAVIADYNGSCERDSEFSRETFNIHFAKCSVECTNDKGSKSDFGWDIAKNERMSPDVK